jgi:hypothetical protein
VTRRVALLVAAAVLAAGAAVGMYIAARGSGGQGMPAAKRDTALEAAKRLGLVEEYHALHADEFSYRYLVDGRIVMWSAPGGGGSYGRPVVISYRRTRAADVKEAWALLRLLHQRGQSWVIFGPLGEPPPSDFGS